MSQAAGGTVNRSVRQDGCSTVVSGTSTFSPRSSLGQTACTTDSMRLMALTFPVRRCSLHSSLDGVCTPCQRSRGLRSYEDLWILAGIMKPAEERRYSSLSRVLTLVADLLGGKKHDRFSAAKRVGVKPATAYREL